MSQLFAIFEAQFAISELQNRFFIKFWRIFSSTDVVVEERVEDAREPKFGALGLRETELRHFHGRVDHFFRELVEGRFGPFVGQIEFAGGLIRKIDTFGHEELGVHRVVQRIDLVVNREDVSEGRHPEGELLLLEAGVSFLGKLVELLVDALEFGQIGIHFVEKHGRCNDTTFPSRHRANGTIHLQDVRAIITVHEVGFSTNHSKRET